MSGPTVQKLMDAGLSEAEALDALANREAHRGTSVKFYYMNDNHTFHSLRAPTLEGIVAEARRHLIESGYTYGMLCAPIILNAQGKEIGRHGPHAHARGRDEAGLKYFDEQCAVWLDAHRRNPALSTLLSELPIGGER